MDPVITSAALTAGGSALASYLANRSVNNQMKFQERMSNTSYQRSVEDMRLAGINPILSANGGASTPSGASLSAFDNALNSGVTSGRDSYLAHLKRKEFDQEIKMNDKQLEQMDSQINLNNANARAAYFAPIINAATAGASIIGAGGSAARAALGALAQYSTAKANNAYTNAKTQRLNSFKK